MPRVLIAGRLRYEHSFVPNPGFRGRTEDLYSDELSAEIRRQNVPPWQVVNFDGCRSCSEEINVDYGVRSLCFKLRSIGNDKITYCKELYNVRFRVEYPVGLPVGGPPPDLAPTGRAATIAGFACREAEYRGDRHLLVWYTEEIGVSDPTAAVLALEGVPGLVLQTEEITEADAVERVRVTEVSAQAPPPGIFSIPADYRQFESVDAARAEDRRILDEKSAEELRRHPLSAAEREMFAGEWQLSIATDEILIEIGRTGDTEFSFRTTVLTAPAGAAGRVTDARAAMKGRQLMVYSPPNYRLYRVTDGGRRLTLVDSDLWTFTRKSRR